MKKKKRKPLIYNGHSMSFNELYYINGGKKTSVGCKGHSLTLATDESGQGSIKLIMQVPKAVPIRVKADGQVSVDVLASYVELDMNDEAMQELYFALASRLHKSGDVR